jgi:inosine-uridine nucleoside N-ribohydrolase
MHRHTIIIDTDPGIDDAMAIFYALAAPEIEVLGLTTVFGNVPVETATANALSLLEIAGRKDLPVAPGAARPLAMPYRGAVDFVHGADGQGNVNLPPPSLRPLNRSAADFIIDAVSSRPGEITLVTLGPLTNLAMVLLQRPKTAGEVRRVVAMGGNVYVPGNASPAGEANILNDPEAAEMVLSAEWPVTLCGLDVTHRITMTADDLQRIYRVDTPAGRHLARIVPFYHNFYRSHTGRNGIYVHDSTTISWLRHPELFTTEEVPVRVDTSDGIGRGKTWPWNDTDRPGVTVCLDADAEQLVEAEISSLEGMDCVHDHVALPG